MARVGFLFLYMKKHLLLAAMFITLTTSATAIAASAPPENSATKNAPVPGSPPKADPAMFQMHKTEILQHMNAAIAEMQKQQKCIEAAATQEDFQSCRPGMGMYGMGMGMPPMPPPGFHPPESSQDAKQPLPPPAK